MLTLPTAKALLFVALSLGPKDATTIYATSPSESYTWSPNTAGWTVTALGFPASDFSRDPSVDQTLSSREAQSGVPSYLRPLARHDWNREPVLILDNGDRVEKNGKVLFYTYGPGQPNEKTFTFFFQEKD